MKRSEMIKELETVIKASSGYAPETRAKHILNFIEVNMPLEDEAEDLELDKE